MAYNKTVVKAKKSLLKIRWWKNMWSLDNRNLH